jgi:hypothetical protein
VNEMSQRWRAQWDTFVIEVRGNSRLRWMLMAACPIFLFYLALVADDWRQQLVDEYRPLEQRQARLQQLAAGSAQGFEQFHSAEQAAHESLRQQLWQAGTAGLAGADFQSWLRRLTTASGMQKPRIDLSDIRPLEGMEQPLWRLEAEVSGQLQPAQVRALLKELASSEKMVAVERLSYSPQRGDRLSMLIVANFILEAEIAESGP